ncbi:MAG: HEAT repeat domain-containing protein [bacterium]|nr:HEAT repeat domain-containing protein [bacterium]
MGVPMPSVFWLLNSRMAMLLLGAVVVLFMVRRAHRGRTVVPAMNLRPDRIVRWTEAGILAILGATIMVIAVTDTSNGGVMTRLGSVPMSLAVAQLVAVAVVLAFGVMAVMLAWRGYCTPGIILMAIVLCAYGTFQNGPGRPMQALAEARTQKAEPGEITIGLSEKAVRGADLWVNDVYLGKTPVTMPFEEFFDKVPDRPIPPKEFTEDEYEVHLPKHDGPSGRSASIRRTLSKFEVDAPDGWGPRDAPREHRTCYARVAYGGEVGLGGRGSGSSSGGFQLFTHFSALFPEREHRLETLLDQARLADYAVGPDWFEAIETYGPHGSWVIRERAGSEPELMQVFRDWGAWQHDLVEVPNAASAWDIFERVMQRADDEQQYLTASPAGALVESLVPMLDADRLVDLASDLLESSTLYDCVTWRDDGGFQFGISRRRDGLFTGAGTMHRSGGWGLGGRRLPVHTAAVAHAVWLKDQELDTAGEPHPNAIEERLVPLLIHRAHPNYGFKPSLQVAVVLGGPDIERFILRHDWLAEAGSLDWKDRMSGGNDENLWTYSLANLDSEGAARARREHSQRFVALAGRLNDLSQWGIWGRWDREVAFLFRDLEHGHNSLAWQYWQRFHKKMRTRSDSRERLHALWRYLTLMEPLPTVKVYVDCLGDAKVEWHSEAPDLLDEIPAQKRVRVIDAVVAAVQADEQAGEPKYQEFIRDVQARKDPHGIEAVRVLKALKEGDEYTKPDRVAPWLEHTAPESPLVAMLAADDDPALRVLVMGALRAHPTTANRAILAKLVNDPDDSVRAAAVDVRAHLDELAATPPSAFVSDPTGKSLAAEETEGEDGRG